MAILNAQELVNLRRAMAAGQEVVDWDKPTVNAAFQGVEDVLEAQGFDASVFVSLSTTSDAEAQTVESALTANRIPADLVPVVEDWLAEHPASTTLRSVDTDRIRDWVQVNQAAFGAAVSVMPLAQRLRIIRFVVRRRVQAVI